MFSTLLDETKCKQLLEYRWHGGLAGGREHEKEAHPRHSVEPAENHYYRFLTCYTPIKSENDNQRKFNTVPQPTRVGYDVTPQRPVHPPLTHLCNIL